MTKSAKPRKQHFFNLHVTSTISIALVLFLVGLMTLLMFLGRDVSNYVKESVGMSVILDDSISTNNRAMIEKFYKTTSYAKSYTYISKDQALEDHIRDLGDNPKDFLGYNPLLASYEVKLNADYANIDSITRIEQALKQIAGVKQVIYQRDIIHLVNDNIKKTGFILLGIAAILLFISIVLLNNTIRITIYSKRFTINTMKLVGARSGFIRGPIVRRNLLNGLISAVIAIALLAGTLYHLQKDIGTNFNLLRPDVIVTVSCVVILFGFIISYFASLFAVNRYLRMRTDNLYYI